MRSSAFRSSSSLKYALGPFRDPTPQGRSFSQFSMIRAVGVKTLRESSTGPYSTTTAVLTLDSAFNLDLCVT